MENGRVRGLASWFDRLVPWLIEALVVDAALHVVLVLCGVDANVGTLLLTGVMIYPLVLSVLLLVRLWICLILRRSPALTVLGHRFGGGLVTLVTLGACLMLTLSREHVLPSVYEASLHWSTTKQSSTFRVERSTGPDLLALAGLRDVRPVEDELTVVIRPENPTAAALIRDRILASLPDGFGLRGRIHVRGEFPRVLLPLYKQVSQEFEVSFAVRLESPGLPTTLRGNGTGSFDHTETGLLSSYDFRQSHAIAFADFVLDRIFTTQ